MGMPESRLACTNYGTLIMKQNGETRCPKCSIGKLWVGRLWRHENDKSIGLKGIVRCDTYPCNYIDWLSEDEWGIKLHNYMDNISDQTLDEAIEALHKMCARLIAGLIPNPPASLP